MELDVEIGQQKAFHILNSWAFFGIFEFLEFEQNIRMQGLNHRFYNVFGP